MKLNRRLEAAAKKVNVDFEDAMSIVAYHHQINSGFFKAKELVNIPINADSKTVKFVNKIAKTLKVDADAVVAFFIVKYMLENRNEV